MVTSHRRLTRPVLGVGLCSGKKPLRGTVVNSALGRRHRVEKMRGPVVQ